MCPVDYDLGAKNKRWLDSYCLNRCQRGDSPQAVHCRPPPSATSEFKHESFHVVRCLSCQDCCPGGLSRALCGALDLVARPIPRRAPEPEPKAPRSRTQLAGSVTTMWMAAWVLDTRSGLLLNYRCIALRSPTHTATLSIASGSRPKDIRLHKTVMIIPAPRPGLTYHKTDRSPRSCPGHVGSGRRRTCRWQGLCRAGVTS